MTAAKSVYESMTAVMAAVQKVSKDGRVTEGPARYNFRGVDAVVNAVGPVLREHGVIVVPHDVVHVEHERYLTGNNKPMHGVTVTIRWRFYGPAGDFIEAASAGEAADAGDKAVSKAHSVAYRTVLLQALCIPTDEPDPDSQVHERAAEPPADPLANLRADVKRAGEARGMSVAEIGDDFTAWSTGVTIPEADADLLVRYVQYLRALPVPEPVKA